MRLHRDRDEQTTLAVREGNTPDYPMQSYNGMVVAKPDRRAPSCDYDLTPRQFRRFVGASGVHEVQLQNGLFRGVGNGKIRNHNGEGYLYAVVPHWPGQARYEAGGYHKKGMDPLSMAAVFQNGPGSQPANPGGPGKIAAPLFVNPMTG